MVEKSKLAGTVTAEQFDHIVEGAGFRDVDLFQQAGNCLTHRAAEQWMVVGDHQTILLLALHL